MMDKKVKIDNLYQSYPHLSYMMQEQIKKDRLLYQEKELLAKMETSISQLPMHKPSTQMRMAVWEKIIPTSYGLKKIIAATLLLLVSPFSFSQSLALIPLYEMQQGQDSMLYTWVYFGYGLSICVLLFVLSIILMQKYQGPIQNLEKFVHSILY